MFLSALRSIRPVRCFVLSGLIAGCATYLASFAIHAWLILSFPYPLDYGEGPLLAQVEFLQTTPAFWHIYRDPSASPYMVVNYPPVYLVVATVLSWATGNALLAGRLVSLLAALGCVVALVLLVDNRRLPRDNDTHLIPMVHQWALFSSLFFLTVPIVREWAVLMRVDMLGVCLGLWGLVAVRHRRVSIAGVVFVLALYTKPSLIAAPVAGVLWLLLSDSDVFSPQRTQRAQRGKQFWCHALTKVRGTLGSFRRSWRSWRFGGSIGQSLMLLAIMGIGSGGLFLLLQWASHGWFFVHVVAANVNRWDGDLAWQFWVDQARIRWPLMLAGVLGAFVVDRGQGTGDRGPSLVRRVASLPLLYTALGIVTALGVGKVGAYPNYFLEFYAGLVWLSGSLLTQEASEPRPTFEPQQPWRSWRLGGSIQHIIIPGLLAASLLSYLPLWSKTTLYQAGLLTANPPRLAFGTYALWDELEREVAVLAARKRVHGALVPEVQAAGPVLFTDMPGVASEAGVVSRIQAFEHRQLWDQGLWQQQPLLYALANGEIDLAVIDYLGNWLTPQMIELIQRRYAHDGMFGTFDLYRPVDAGPRVAFDVLFGSGLQLSGVHVAMPSVGAKIGATHFWECVAPTPLIHATVATHSTESIGGAFEPGEMLVVTLEWQRIAATDEPVATGIPDVVLRVVDDAGKVWVESVRPLLYGVLPLDEWQPDVPVQHMQPVALPVTMPAGDYQVMLGVREGNNKLSAPHVLAHIHVRQQGGRFFDATSFFVPAPFMHAWEEVGGARYAGNPLTPAVPFAWGRLQCFEHSCLEWRAGKVTQRPLGTRLYLAETIRRARCLDSPVVRSLCPGFAALWESYGGAAPLGDVISGEVYRNYHIVQWTEYARLERLPDGSYAGLGRLGDDSLGLSPGMRYRWP